MATYYLKEFLPIFEIAERPAPGSEDEVRTAARLNITRNDSRITGAVRSMVIEQTMTTAATASQVEALRVEITSNVKTGAWANAIMAQIDYSTSGAAHGMAATICAEMVPPNSSLARGALYALDLEFGCGASSTWASAGPVAFIKFENWGTAAHFSANAFFFHLAGETGAAGALLGANSNTLKVRIGTTTQYLVLSEYEDTLSIGLTGAKKTLVTGVPEIVVWSTSALTSGTQDVVKIDFTQTAAWQTGYCKGLRCTMTSNVKTPGSFNGLKGIIDYQTNGHPHGDCAPVASELIPPNSSAVRGTFSCFEARLCQVLVRPGIALAHYRSCAVSCLARLRTLTTMDTCSLSRASMLARATSMIPI